MKREAAVARTSPSRSPCDARDDALMLSDLDLWRAANVMIKRYADGAASEAAMRADEFLDQGIIDGERLWMRIVQAIEEVQRERPGDGEAVH